MPLVWTGKSALDNETEIGLFVTSKSNNDKTGDMLQTWIMRLDMRPNDAVRSGADSAVCGVGSAKCPHAGSSCYVLTHQAPLSTWKANKDRPVLSMAEIAKNYRGANLRIGSYGDPAAVPVNVWNALIALINPATRTGYTHQWRTNPQLRGLCMASVDSHAEGEQARALGWRTFRVTDPNVLDLQKGEIECVADSHNVQCADCGLCDGSRAGDKRKSIAIRAHGNGKNKVRKS
jgi:hypothetical protein